MIKTKKKIIAYILVVALVLSLMGCSSSLDEPTPNTSPEMTMPEGDFPEGEMPFGEFGGEMPTETESPETTVSPGSGTDVVIKEELTDAYGVYLYSYDTVFTSTASNYVVIRMDDEELLSKDLFITEINLYSYSGDADFDDDELIPEIDEEIQINDSKMKEMFADGYLDDVTSEVGYLVALAREEDGDYYRVEYGKSGWQTIGGETVLEDDQEIYIGLPLYDSGSYEVDITFEIKDSQSAYNFGYFDKEVEDGEEFTLTADSKISKEKADVYVMVRIYEYVEEGTDDLAIAYTEITDYEDSYIRVEVDGKEDLNALAELTKIVDYDEVYAYIYNEDSLEQDNTSSKSDIILVFMEDDGVTSSVDEDKHIEEGDLMWVNYEFTIYDGTYYVFDYSSYDSVNSTVGTTINYIYDISYDASSGDFTENDKNETEAAVELARSSYNDLSEAQEAYLLSLDGKEVQDLYFYTDDAEEAFEAWFKAEYELSSVKPEDYTGYDIVAFLEAAEEFLEELEIVDAFETVLETYELLWETGDTTPTGTFTWGTYTNASIANTVMIEVNTGSSTMVNNVETVLLYLDELSDSDREVVETRAGETYAYLMYLEEQIITDDVEYVMSEISSLVAKYLVSDYTNALLYVDLDSNDESAIGLGATHMIYSTSLFTLVESAYSSYISLAPEKQDLLADYTISVMNLSSSTSASSYENYYYFNSDLIKLLYYPESGGDSYYAYGVTYNSALHTDFEITYKDALFALVEMMEITENLQILFSYIDYTSYFDTEIAKERYVDLVFGTSDENYNHLMYGTQTSLFDYYSYDYDDYEYNDPSENWAIYDLANAYNQSDSVQESIIEEYIEFIELLIYIEEYKLDIAEEFEEMMFEEVSTSNDYSSKTVSTMAGAIDDYIDAILEEDTSFYGSDCLVDVIKYIFTEGFEDMDEAKALIEECFDLDEMVEFMIENEGYEEED